MLFRSADFFGFGVEQDKKMLAKYGWHVAIEDIRTHFQKTEFAYRMASSEVTEWSEPPVASGTEGEKVLICLAMKSCGHCLSEGLGESALAVKMPSVRTRTRRPHGALLQLYIDPGYNMCSIAGRL